MNRDDAYVNEARNSALYRGGRFADDNGDPFPFQCAEVAAEIARRVVDSAPPPPDEPFEPSYADRIWEASGGTVNLYDAMLLTAIPPDELARVMAEDAGLNVAEAGILDAWEALAQTPRSVPARVKTPMRPISDRDMARMGAVG